MTNEEILNNYFKQSLADQCAEEGEGTVPPKASQCTEIQADPETIIELMDLARQQGAAEQREKLEICIAALNSIASWYDGPEVNGSFDSPGDAQTARNALEAIANAESKLTEGKIRTQGTEQSDGQTGEEGAKE